MIRAKVCEEMGWTFAEYDDTPVVAIEELLEVWRIDATTKPKGKS